MNPLAVVLVSAARQKLAAATFAPRDPEHGLAVARAFLKTATAKDEAAKNLAVPLGKLLARAGTGAKFIHTQSGRVGAGIAEGLGSGESGQAIGRRAAQAGALGTGYVGAKKGKRKVDEFRYRHGLYRG